MSPPGPKPVLYLSERWAQCVNIAIRVEPGVSVLQAILLDSLFGTERGLKASSELRGEINELITQLEAGSPNRAPNEVCLLLETWQIGLSVFCAGRRPFGRLQDKLPLRALFYLEGRQRSLNLSP